MHAALLNKAEITVNYNNAINYSSIWAQLVLQSQHWRNRSITSHLLNQILQVAGMSA